MAKNLFCCILSLLLCCGRLPAQDSYNDRAQKYIETYAPFAIEEQQRSGVPAAITLGQGILETEAGASELMTQANNHFGIKCKSDWDGDKFLHTDDAPNECFKKYKCAHDSYKDHSDYLKRNPRYTPLFTIKTTDYKGWAVCLRKCGYATNPQYAQNLIKIIETFNLQNYTLSAMDSSLISRQPITPLGDVDEATANAGTMQNTADSAHNFFANKIAGTAVEPNVTDGKIVTLNDMKAFYARRGESLRPYATKYKVSYARLLEWNDLPDAPFAFNGPVYLEKKQTLGTKPTHMVLEGENLLLVSQLEGIQLKKLMAMNMLNPNEEPVPGSVLYLQSATATKPDVHIGATIAHKTNAIETGADTVARPDNDYIAINRAKPAEKPVAPIPVPPPAPAPVHTDTVVKHKEEPVVVVPPPPVHADIVKPFVPKATHVIVVKTENVAPKPKLQEMPVAVVPGNIATPAEKADTGSEADFEKLKADLDKVVYADDSKLLGKTGSIPVPKSTEPQALKDEMRYTVKRGDTAFSIAKRNNITVDELLEWNKIDASGIKVGKNLRVK